MTKIFVHSIILNLLVRITIGMFFVYTGTSKLLDMNAFMNAVDSYGILPETLIIQFSYTLVPIEIFAGLGLMFNFRFSLEVITGCLLLFIAVICYALWAGLDIDCGCFSPSDPEIMTLHGLKPALYKNLLIFSGILFLYVNKFFKTKEAKELKKV